MTDNQNNQDENREASWEEVAYSNMVQNEALLSLLVKKGIITQEEFVNEAKEIHKEYQKKMGQGH